MREFARDLRIAELVRAELARIIGQRMRDPRVGGVNVNDVRVSRDLSFADVYVSSTDAGQPAEKQDLVAVLNGASGYLRSQLAAKLSMRTTPKPRFHYDASVDRGARLEQLIAEAVAADQSQSARADG